MINILIPIRCMSCGKPIAHLWDTYKQRIEKGEEAGKVLNELGLKRYCCRAVFLGTVDLSKQIGKFKK